MKACYVRWVWDGSGFMLIVHLSCLNATDENSILVEVDGRRVQTDFVWLLLLLDGQSNLDERGNRLEEDRALFCCISRDLPTSPSAIMGSLLLCYTERRNSKKKGRVGVGIAEEGVGAFLLRQPTKMVRIFQNHCLVPDHGKEIRRLLKLRMRDDQIYRRESYIHVNHIYVCGSEN